MPPRLKFSTALLFLALSGATHAQAQTPFVVPGGPLFEENAETVDALFTRNLVNLGEDRERAVSGQIDPVSYLRTNLDGMPIEVLDGLRPLGAQIVVIGQDPSDPARTLREVRFSDKALAQIPGNHFRPRDHLEFTVAVDTGRRMKLTKASLANGLYVPPEEAAKP
jgi:hypothetical protein